MHVKAGARLMAVSAGLVLVTGCNLQDLFERLGDLDKSERVEKLVTAAEGGEITIKDVVIEIPAGALAEDTTITAETLDVDDQPDSGNIASAVIDFGPDGLQFQAPVTLTFDYEKSGPPGATPKIAYLEAGVWTTLDDSADVNGKLAGTTTHFTPFAVIWEGGQSGGACEDLEFTPCGGELVGKWAFELGCVKLPSDHVPVEGCPAATANYDVEVTGTITLDAATHGYTIRGDQTVRKQVRAPKTCLPEGRTCADIPELDEKFESAAEDGDHCIVTGKPEVEDKGSSGTWSVDETSLVLDKTAGSSSVFDYCVTGDTALVRTVDDDGVEQRYRLTKQQ